MILRMYADITASFVSDSEGGSPIITTQIIDGNGSGITHTIESGVSLGFNYDSVKVKRLYPASTLPLKIAGAGHFKLTVGSASLGSGTVDLTEYLIGA